MSKEAALQTIPIEAIHPSPYQYRTRFDDEKQHQLLESMKQSGQSSPILVRPRADGYELVSGERRWRAGKDLGWEKIRAVVEEMTDEEAAARVVTENEVRADANIMEKAAGYKRLTQPPCEWNYEVIARRYGWSSATSVRRLVELLDQPQEIQELLIRSRDRISEIHVRFLNRIKDLNARVKMAKRAADEGWSSRMTEKEVEKLLNKAHKKSPKKAGPDDQYVYNHFTCKLVGREIEVSGRRFKMDEEMLDEYISALRMAIVCFRRDIEDRAKPAQETLGSSELADPGTRTVAAIPLAHLQPTTSTEPTATEPTVDPQKEEANFKSGGQSLKDILAEISPSKPPTDPGTSPEEPPTEKASNS